VVSLTNAPLPVNQWSRLMKSRLPLVGAPETWVKLSQWSPPSEVLSTKLAGEARLGIFEDAVRGLSTYHTRPIVAVRDGAIVVEDMKLLFYYQNRTAHIPAEGSS